MKQYKFLILLISITISACGQSKNQNIMKDNEEYTIFIHTRVMYTDSERDIITVNDTLIQSLPEDVKTIISRYSLSLPDYMLDEEQRTKLAKSLGDFSSLRDAQKSLLKKWGENFKPSGEPVYLGIKKTGNVFIFEYGFIYGMNYVLDEFKIDITGKISFVNRSEIKDTWGY